MTQCHLQFNSLIMYKVTEAWELNATPLTHFLKTKSTNLTGHWEKCCVMRKKQTNNQIQKHIAKTENTIWKTPTNIKTLQVAQWRWVTKQQKFPKDVKKKKRHYLYVVHHESLFTESLIRINKKTTTHEFSSVQCYLLIYS